MVRPKINWRHKQRVIPTYFLHSFFTHLKYVRYDLEVSLLFCVIFVCSFHVFKPQSVVLIDNINVKVIKYHTTYLFTYLLTHVATQSPDGFLASPKNSSTLVYLHQPPPSPEMLLVFPASFPRGLLIRSIGLVSLSRFFK